jgi:hypothetical protein
LDSSRVRTGEIVAGIGGLALFVFLFFDWFSGGAELTGTPGDLSLSQPGISGWDALTDLPGFLIILSGVSGIALICLAAAGQRVNIPVRRGTVTALLGVLAILLILWRMVAGSPTLKVGIFLGLAAAIAITVGALMALAEDGWTPLVAVSGATTRAAAASAPPATPSPPPASAAAAGGSTSGGAGTATKSTTKRSTTKRSTTRRSPTRSGSGRGGSRSGAKRSSGSRTTSSRSRSSGSRSTSRSKSSRSGSKATRSRSSGSRASSTRSRSSSSKKKGSSGSGKRSGGTKRSASRKK